MLLVIDTSGPALTTGLFDGERSLAARSIEIGRGHAERLSSAVSERLDEAGAVVSDLTQIAVVVGPGSFTGLRAGLAFARGLALGLDVPAVGVSRMQALARPHGPVHVVLDARRGAVFEQVFTDENEPMGDLALTPIDAFETGTPCMVGSGAPLVVERARRGRIADESDAPTPETIAALARHAPLPPRPIYGRGADAKVQRSPLLGG